MGILLESATSALRNVHSLSPILAWQFNVSEYHLIHQYAAFHPLSPGCSCDASSLALQPSRTRPEPTHYCFLILSATYCCRRHDSAGIGHIHLSTHIRTILALVCFMGALDCCAASFRRAHCECSVALMHCASYLSLTLRGQFANINLSQPCACSGTLRFSTRCRQPACCYCKS